MQILEDLDRLAQASCFGAKKELQHVAKDVSTGWWHQQCQLLIPGGLQVVFESPVPRLEKDRDWTGPRPEKTGPAV